MFGLPIHPAPPPFKDIIDCIKKGSGVIKSIQDKNKNTMKKYITKVDLPYIPKGSELKYDEDRNAYWVEIDKPINGDKYRWYDKEIVEAEDNQFFVLDVNFNDTSYISDAMIKLGLRLDVDVMMDVKDFLIKYNDFIINDMPVPFLEKAIRKAFSNKNKKVIYARALHNMIVHSYQRLSNKGGEFPRVLYDSIEEYINTTFKEEDTIV